MSKLDGGCGCNGGTITGGSNFGSASFPSDFHGSFYSLNNYNNDPTNLTTTSDLHGGGRKKKSKSKSYGKTKRHNRSKKLRQTIKRRKRLTAVIRKLNSPTASPK